MGEYTYHEFLAQDRPLTKKQMAELRDISSRAEITPTSFWNEYHWGDLKADPLDLLARYFDVYLYTGYETDRQIGIRLPLDAPSPALLEQYLVGETAWVQKTKHCRVLSLIVSEGEFEPEPVDRYLGRIAPLRLDVLKGDLRSLYLGWLVGIWEADEEALEPPVPAGLRELTPALKALTRFFDLDRDLLKAAAETSPRMTPRGDEAAARAWLAERTEEERQELLVSALLDGETLAAARGSFRLVGGHEGTFSSAPRRTVRELRERADAIRERRQARQWEEIRRQREEREALEREARKRHLAAVATREGEVWKEVHDLIATRAPKSYDAAVRHLVDLREVLHEQGRTEEMQRRVADLRAQHGKKDTLLKRLDAAGLTWDPALSLPL